MNIHEKIIKILQKYEYEGMTIKSLVKEMHLPKKKKPLVINVVNKLKVQGLVIKQGDLLFVKSKSTLIKAEIVKIATSFGFARSLKDAEIEYFIPGRFLRGAMVGDIVLLKEKESLGQSPEAIVERIVQCGKGGFVGVYTENEEGKYILPDKMNIPIRLDSFNLIGAKDGDKVYAELVKRGRRHFDHTAEIIQVFGKSEIASVCAQSILAEHQISLSFSDSVINEADKIAELSITEKDLKNRSDFRDKMIFTIDSAHAKDLDDAISIQKNDNGYILGVHIADVSHYVKKNSPIDEEAYERGTSLYYANKVVPMLPPQLSNGLCSLNPNEDRLTFSALIQLSNNGKIVKYDFQKSVIRSKVKGVYSEINDILEDTADEEIQEKYKEFIPTIHLMKELADILTQARVERGGFELDSSESQLIIDENQVAVDIIPRERGISERIIEEFMLIANQAAATFSTALDIPFLYRIHEKPSLAKIQEMNETLAILGLATKEYDVNISQKQIGRLLEKVKGTQLQPVINDRVLRMMSKAKYSDQLMGHYGLVLKKYSHFTSPIRRYPDLVIHRIMTDVLINGVDSVKKYARFVKNAALQSTEREITAMTVERDCEDLYKAEYMQKYIGEKFQGIIVGIAPHGIFVELKNSVQGRVALEDLPGGSYKMESNIRYRNTDTNKTYTIGDSVEIKVIKSHVPTGTIDFMFTPQDDAVTL